MKMTNVKENRLNSLQLNSSKLIETLLIKNKFRNQTITRINIKFLKSTWNGKYVVQKTTNVQKFVTL